MKKLLLILCITLVGCSTEDEEKELIEVTEYYISLSKDCKISSADTFEVREDDYDFVTSIEDLGDCEIYYTMMPDIRREKMYEGYLVDADIKTYQK